MSLLSIFVSSVKNAIRNKSATVTIKYNGLILAICKVLHDEGFISSYEVVDTSGKVAAPDCAVKFIKIGLRYGLIGKSRVTVPAISTFSLVSKSGSRFYVGVEAMKSSFDGLGRFIVSTNRGVMTDVQARQMNLGGEVILEVF